MTKTKEIKDTVNELGVEVGMVTCCSYWTDRYPAKVIAVTSKTFTIVRVNRGKNKEQYPAQDWEIEWNNVVSNPIKVYNTKRGLRGQGGSLKVGKPCKLEEVECPGCLAYEDPHF